MIDRVTADAEAKGGNIVVCVRVSSCFSSIPFLFFGPFCLSCSPSTTVLSTPLQIRPPNQRELDGGAKNIIVHAETRKKVRLDNVAGGAPYYFEYDEAIEATATQLDVFERVGLPAVQDAFNGYNVTIFAYGQTSSGKSFSMMGKLADFSEGLSDMAGIIPRVAHLLFATSHSLPESHQFFVEASFIEIYNEKVIVGPIEWCSLISFVLSGTSLSFYRSSDCEGLLGLFLFLKI